MKHAAIIPLIGGEILGSESIWNAAPDYLLSYSAFEANETHLLNYYKNRGDNIPYYQLDKGGSAPYTVDVISSTCPCAGLSQYSFTSGEGNPANEWMEKTARYILGEVKPKVFWGENSPQLVGKVGEFMLKKLRQIGLENGYSFSVFLTKNILHGVSQFRKRSFYFFWKKSEFEGKTPKFNKYFREYTPIEKLIADVSSNFQQEPINKKIPSQDPYYRYLLEEVYGGITHREFFDVLETKNCRGNDVESLIESYGGHDYLRVAEWMKKQGYDREVPKCERKYHKLASGGNIMRRSTIVPKDYIGAFVGHYPQMLTHPYEDRYITYREAMTIMGLPSDFELLNPEKSVNHICQNVHTTTAADMTREIKAVFDSEREMIDTDFLFQNNYDGSIKDMKEPEKSTLEMFM